MGSEKYRAMNANHNPPEDENALRKEPTCQECRFAHDDRGEHYCDMSTLDHHVPEIGDFRSWEYNCGTPNNPKPGSPPECPLKAGPVVVLWGDRDLTPERFEEIADAVETAREAYSKIFDEIEDKLSAARSEFGKVFNPWLYR